MPPWKRLYKDDKSSAVRSCGPVSRSGFVAESPGCCPVPTPHRALSPTDAAWAWDGLVPGFLQVHGSLWEEFISLDAEMLPNLTTCPPVLEGCRLPARCCLWGAGALPPSHSQPCPCASLFWELPCFWSHPCLLLPRPGTFSICTVTRRCVRRRFCAARSAPCQPSSPSPCPPVPLMPQ